MRQPSLARARTVCRPRNPDAPKTVTMRPLISAPSLRRGVADRAGRVKGTAQQLTSPPPGLSHPPPFRAQMAELVDALLSGSSAARRGGSSPLLGTRYLFEVVREQLKNPQKSAIF